MGSSVAFSVGAVVGISVGFSVANCVGFSVVGASVELAVGLSVVGASVELVVGLSVVGASVVNVGELVGLSSKLTVGAFVTSIGMPEGIFVGSFVEGTKGFEVLMVGFSVDINEGEIVTTFPLVGDSVATAGVAAISVGVKVGGVVGALVSAGGRLMPSNSNVSNHLWKSSPKSSPIEFMISLAALASLPSCLRLLRRDCAACLCAFAASVIHSTDSKKKAAFVILEPCMGQIPSRQSKRH